MKLDIQKQHYSLFIKYLFIYMYIYISIYIYIYYIYIYKYIRRTNKTNTRKQLLVKPDECVNMKLIVAYLF